MRKITIRPVLFYFFAALFASGGLILLEGLTEGLEPWVQSAFAFDPHPEELRFHGAVHGALIGLLFSGSLVMLLCVYFALALGLPRSEKTGTAQAVDR